MDPAVRESPRYSPGAGAGVLAVLRPQQARSNLCGALTFGDDPFDAVGSFGIQVALLAGLLAVWRVCRPLFDAHSRKYRVGLNPMITCRNAVSHRGEAASADRDDSTGRDRGHCGCGWGGDAALPGGGVRFADWLAAGAECGGVGIGQSAGWQVGLCACAR